MEFASMIASRSGHVCTIYFNFDLSSTLPTLLQDLLLNKSCLKISCIFFDYGVFLRFFLITDMPYISSIQIIHDPMISSMFLANQSLVRKEMSICCLFNKCVLGIQRISLKGDLISQKSHIIS